jgi:Rod binding domain-containing protein
MDIHLLPGAVVAAASANPKQAGQGQQPEGTFHQALSQAAAAAKPAIAKSATAKPMIGKPAIDQSVIARPALAMPAIAQPVLAQPVIAQAASATSAVAKPTTGKPAAGKPDQVSQAATQFEALIIGQVLKAARESSDQGWLGTGDDKTSDMAMEMAEQGLAQGLAAQGGLGIAKMVTAKLRRDDAKAANSAPGAQVPRVQLSKDSGQTTLTPTLTLTPQH